MQYKNELKQVFTSYWHFLALQKACQFHIFDILENEHLTITQLAKRLNLNLKPLHHLLAFLVEENYLLRTDDFLSLTETGFLLTEKHPESLKNACILWGEEHLNAWQNLDLTLKTGKSSFEQLYQKPFFDYLMTQSQKLKNYHFAMRDYAKDDYKAFPLICDLSQYATIADIGGGLGVLIGYIAEQNPQSKCTVFDLPSVTQLIENQDKQPFDIVSGSFFEPLPFNADVLILARILHDWNDEKCSQILDNCKKGLNSSGNLYILEIMQDEIEAHLMSLNMLVMCESYERTYAEYANLLEKSGFQTQERKKLNSLQTILICKCNIMT